MKQQSARTLIALITIVTVTEALAFPPSIGVASARGEFWVDKGKIVGNATLFEGSVLETRGATSDVSLQTGVQLLLGTDSRCTLYRNHMVLEKGMGQVEKLDGYRVRAGRVLILSDSAVSKGVVVINGANLVEVASLAGQLRVMTDNGMLLARVNPGRPLTFDTKQSGVMAVTTLSGMVTNEAGHLLLMVAETGVKYEIVGEGLEDAVGKIVAASGTIDLSQKAVGDASAVLRVTKWAVVVEQTAAGTASAAATGMATSTKVIIAGTAVAAAGVAIGVKVAKEKVDKPPASR